MWTFTYSILSTRSGYKKSKAVSNKVHILISVLTITIKRAFIRLSQKSWCFWMNKRESNNSASFKVSSNISQNVYIWASLIAVCTNIVVELLGFVAIKKLVSTWKRLNFQFHFYFGTFLGLSNNSLNFISAHSLFVITMYIPCISS